MDVSFEDKSISLPGGHSLEFHFGKDTDYSLESDESEDDTKKMVVKLPAHFNGDHGSKGSTKDWSHLALRYSDEDSTEEWEDYDSATSEEEKSSSESGNDGNMEMPDDIHDHMQNGTESNKNHTKTPDDEMPSSKGNGTQTSGEVEEMPTSKENGTTEGHGMLDSRENSTKTGDDGKHTSDDDSSPKVRVLNLMLTQPLQS